MKIIKIVHLYPKEMNIYGDNGNVRIIEKRLTWLGYKSEVVSVGVGDKLPPGAAIIFGGGGQDAGQADINQDLLSKRQVLHKMAKDGVPMLMICGMYQMLGHYFKTASDQKIPGIGIFDMTTIASQSRIIGNIVVETADWGKIIGYENHSGRTFLGNEVTSLGNTKINQGNNGQDLSEGARFNNVFGSYLHGPILAKNSRFSDYFIEIITGKKVDSFNEKIAYSDKLAAQASSVALKLSR